MPDLLVGTRDRNVLLECKDGTKPPSARKLTPAQEAWHKAWRGKVAVVNTPVEALEACLGMSREVRELYYSDAHIRTSMIDGPSLLALRREARSSSRLDGQTQSAPLHVGPPKGTRIA